MAEHPMVADGELYRIPADMAWDLLQFTTVLYYLHETNPDNMLVRDKTDPKAPVSIAAVGMSLATTPVIVERDVIIREFAAKLTLKKLRYLLECPQGPEPDSSGYKGFFYHFLDIETGRRAWQCELSTIDSAFLFAGALTVATYFDRDTADEAEIRSIADALYRRADWNWARDGEATLKHGWRPESGFIPHRWQGYDEGLLLYILGLGSPTYPLPTESYHAYCATYQWKTIYNRELLYSGPLFTHQLSHMWIDFRGIRDDYMRQRSSDYFENSRQATFVQQEYAVRNPMNFGATENTAGDSRHAMDPVGPNEWSTASNANSSTTSLAALHSVPMTAPLPRGWSSPPCRSLQRLWYRLCAILPRWTWA